jgi:transcriptional regulator with XRE-family HTH domain
MEDPQASIRLAIRRRRRLLGLTQDELSALVGLSRVTYHRIEHGDRRLRIEELGALCRVFCCPASDLIDDAALARSYATIARSLLGDEPVESAVL